MKLTPAKFNDFLKNVSFDSKSILLFGPDSSLLAFKRQQFLQALQKTYSFQTLYLEEPPATLEEILGDTEPSLFKELDSHNKVFVLSSVKDSFLKVLEAGESVLGKNAILLLEGVGLAVSSKIVKYHEAQPGCFCLGVYEQTVAEKRSYVQSLGDVYNLMLGTQELAYLTDCLPSDPLMIEREIEKLSLYKGSSPISIDDVQAVIEPESSEELDVFLNLVCVGDKEKLTQAYYVLKRDGHEDMSLLRGLTNHLLRLFQVSSQLKGGVPLQTALETLRPRLFFKTQERFLAHLKLWSPETLALAMNLLKDMELWIKNNQDTIESYLTRGYLKIASYVRR